MVDHDQNGIHFAHFREVSDEIDRELFKGEGECGGYGVQWWANGVRVYLVLLAYSTSFDEFVNIGG